MENFKITIDVNVNLHDDVVGFFGALAQLTMRAVQNGTACPTPMDVEAEAKTEAKTEEAKPKRRKAEEVKAEEVKAEEVKAEEVKAEEVKAEPAITLEDLRTLVKDKAVQGDARQAIKNKLSEMGAERVTALTPEQYVDFYEFLKSL